MDQKTVRDMLRGAENKDLIQIISAMLKKSAEAEQVIIDWCKKNNKDGKKKAIEMELRNLWMEAREVISEFNMYGGGAYSDEDDAADAMWKMNEIVTKHDISWEIRVAILDEMMEEFNIGNSGFDDMLIDIASAFCQTNEEKKYLADVLADGTNDYYKGYAANIYKSIGDDEKFLQTKLGNLRYGSDYVQVAKYYLERNDKKKALDQIWQGMKKCDGRLDDLINFAVPIYIKEGNDVELRRMYEFARKTKWNINIVAIAKQLYHYAKEKGDYDSGKKMLWLILDSCEKDEVEKWFEVCKREFREEDWARDYDRVLEKVRKKNMKFYLDICMQTGKENVVLEKLQKEQHGYNFWDLDHEGYFSKRLFKKYPEEVLALYWQDVHFLLRTANNKNYDQAVRLLRRIKSFMKKKGDLEGWEWQFEELKETHKRKRNFMAMLGGL